MLAAIAYDPLVRIHMRPLAVLPHCVFTALGFLVGVRLLLADTRRRGIGDHAIFPLLTRAGIGGVSA